MTTDRITVATSDRVFSRNVGGNSTYARSIYAHLPAHGVDHRLLHPPVAPSSRRARGLLYAGWEAALPLQACRAGGVDLLHYTNDTGAMTRSASVPTVASIHGIASRHIDGVRGPLQERIWRARVQWTAATAAAVITPSRSSADDIQAIFGVDHDRIHVIAHGVDHTRFRPDAAVRTDGVAALAGLRLPERYVLFLGNLDPRKNVRALMAAFDAPALRRLDVPLIVAGAPAWRDTAIVEDLRAANIRYLGQVPDEAVGPLIARATVFAFPSLYEGFGLPVLEAMACATAVVTSNRGSLPEVTADGQAAAVVDPSPSALAGQIADLLTDDDARRDLERRGPARAAVFTWDGAAARTAAVFHALHRSRGRVAA